MKKIINKINLIICLIFFISSSSFSLVKADSYDLDSFVAGSQVSQADSGTVFNKVVIISFVVGAILAFSYLIYGAISIITSNGEANKKAAGRERITYAAVGLLILAATWGIFSLVMNAAFNSDSLTLPKLDDSTSTN